MLCAFYVGGHFYALSSRADIFTLSSRAVGRWRWRRGAGCVLRFSILCPLDRWSLGVVYVLRILRTVALQMRLKLRPVGECRWYSEVRFCPLYGLLHLALGRMRSSWDQSGWSLRVEMRRTVNG